MSPDRGAAVPDRPGLPHRQFEVPAGSSPPAGGSHAPATPHGLHTFYIRNAVAQFNTALRDQAASRGLDIVDSARMFAAVDMTVSDALITTWRAKLFYGIWRPSTAIQLADTDGNPATTADPAWMPLLVNPPYTDYVSGYNAVTASATRALEDLFGRRHLTSR
jgi:hypothetical protein